MAIKNPVIMCLAKILMSLIFVGVNSSQVFSLDFFTLNFDSAAKEKLEKSLLFTRYVSMARLSKDLYLIANYSNILLFNKSNNYICELTPSFSLDKLPRYLSTDSDVKKIHYNPTAIDIGGDGSIYVANYYGNNVLRGNLDVASCSIYFTSEYKAPHMEITEGVIVSNNHGILISANYQSGDVTAFDIKTGSVRWKRPLAQAHALTIKNDIVYASSLWDRKIVAYNIESGAVVNQVGVMGANPWKGQFLWPTSLSIDGDGDLIVTDAHTGYIAFLDANTLKTKKVFGGNGPGMDNLNYPYGAYFFGDEGWIVSTFSGRLLRTDTKFENVIADYWSYTPAWKGSGRLKKQTTQLSYWDKSEWVDYVNNKKGTILSGQFFFLGYGKLVSGNKKFSMAMPDVGTLYNPVSYMYFTQSVKIQDKMNAIVSSTSPNAVVVYNPKNSHPSYFGSVKIKEDSWVINGGLFSGRYGDIDTRNIGVAVKRRASHYYKVINKLGWLPFEEYLRLEKQTFKDYFYSKTTEKNPLMVFDVLFVTPQGKKFKKAYDLCNAREISVAQLKESAHAYYASLSMINNVPIDEYFLVGMLSGEEASLPWNHVIGQTVMTH